MKKKGLVCVIIVLFLGMAFVSSAGSLSAEKCVSADKHITTPPEVEVTWEAYKVDGKWYIDFICDSSEGMSDIDSVGLYIDDLIHATIAGPPYTCQNSSPPTRERESFLMTLVS